MTKTTIRKKKQNWIMRHRGKIFIFALALSAFLNWYDTVRNQGILFLCDVAELFGKKGTISICSEGKAFKGTAKPYEQVLSGSIRTETGEPLAGVTVSLPEFGKTVKTDNLGRFELKVEAKHQATVELMALKDGYKPHEQYATLGNTSMSFTMKPTR
jgi:hypothetical protein